MCNFCERIIEQIQEDLITLRIKSLGNSGCSRNLFFVHAVDGGIGSYKKLARCLDNDANIHGISAFDFAGRSPFPDTINAAAANYADGILQLQPAGPYFLAGWSLGGHIACEVGRELARRGKNVGGVAVLDSHMASMRAGGAASPPQSDSQRGKTSQLQVKLSRVKSWHRFLLMYFAKASNKMPVGFWLGSDDKKARFLLEKCRDTDIFAPGNALQDARTVDDILLMLDTIDRQFNASWDCRDRSPLVPILCVKNYKPDCSPALMTAHEKTVDFWRDLSTPQFSVSWIEGRHDAVLQEAGASAAAQAISQFLARVG